MAWAGVQDGYAALAELLGHHDDAQFAALVLVDPTRLDVAGLVMDALARYRPHAAVWRYDERADPALDHANRRELATVFVRTEAQGQPPGRNLRDLAGAIPPPHESSNGADTENGAAHAAEGHAPGAATGTPDGHAAAAEQPPLGDTRENGEDDDRPASALLSAEELSLLLADRPGR